MTRNLLFKTAHTVDYKIGFWIISRQGKELSTRFYMNRGKTALSSCRRAGETQQKACSSGGPPGAFSSIPWHCQFHGADTGCSTREQHQPVFSLRGWKKSLSSLEKGSPRPSALPAGPVCPHSTPLTSHLTRPETPAQLSSKEHLVSLHAKAMCFNQIYWNRNTARKLLTAVEPGPGALLRQKVPLSLHWQINPPWLAAKL